MKCQSMIDTYYKAENGGMERTLIGKVMTEMLETTVSKTAN